MMGAATGARTVAARQLQTQASPRSSGYPATLKPSWLKLVLHEAFGHACLVRRVGDIRDLYPYDVAGLVDIEHHECLNASELAGCRIRWKKDLKRHAVW